MARLTVFFLKDLRHIHPHLFSTFN
jgi:hypothetical protein